MMFRGILSTSMLLITVMIAAHCLTVAGSADAAQIVVALSPDTISKSCSVVSDGCFVLSPLEAMRVALDGSAPQPVFPGHADGAESRRRSGENDPVALSRIFSISVPESTNLLDAAYQLSKLPGVEWAEPIFDFPFIPEAPIQASPDYEPPAPEYDLESSDEYVVPNDPMFCLQSALRQMRLPEAWAISTGSTQVIIAAMDTGYMPDHPDLVGTMWDNPEERNGPSDANGYLGDVHGWNFSLNTPQVRPDDPSQDRHGIQCTSQYSARGNNAIGIAGIIWDANVMVTVRSFYPVQLMGAQNAVYAADNGARVAHASFAFYNSYSRTGKAAFEYARSKGLLVCVSAGNESVFVTPYPAGYPDVMSVAGVDRFDVNWHSNYGYWARLSTPIDGAAGCAPPSGYDFDDALYGTSSASPQAAGVAALLLAIHPDWDPDLLEAHLRATALPVVLDRTSIEDTQMGHECGPRVDAYAALATEPRVEFSIAHWQLKPRDGGGTDVELVLHLENVWKGASNVQLSLSCEDPNVGVVEGHAALGDMRPLEVKTNSDSPFLLALPPELAPNYRCALTVEASADELDQPQVLTLDVVLNSVMVPHDGWPSPQCDPYQYPPMSVDLNGDGVREVLCPTGVGYQVYSAQGELLDEIPVVPMSSQPAVADLDGDLADELVFADAFNGLHVFDEELGLLTLAETGQMTTSKAPDYVSICVGAANLCGNSGRQIVVIRRYPGTTSQLCVYNMDGTMLEGFPFEGSAGSENVAAADFDGDGIDELAVWAKNVVYLLNNKGQPLPGWPRQVAASVGEVAAGDIDGDGRPELVTTSRGRDVFAFKVDGSLMPGWPFHRGGAVFYVPPVLADVTGDGREEVVLVEWGTEQYALRGPRGSIIHVVDWTGQELPGWPVNTGIVQLQPPIACDVNGDGKQDILVTSSRGVLAYDYTGRMLPGWPLIVAPEARGAYSYSTPTVDDFDGDGTLDLGISLEGRYFIYSIQGSHAGDADWGYRGRTADMRFGSIDSAEAPTMVIEPESRSLLAGMDSLVASIIISNPGEERTVVASAWIEAVGLRFYLPSLSVDEQTFTLTLPSRSLFSLPNIVNVPIPQDIFVPFVELKGRLIDSSTGDVLSSPSVKIWIERYVPPSGGIVVEGPMGGNWQTFSFMPGPSSLRPFPHWEFGDGKTSDAERPGHLFEAPGEYTINLTLADERGGRFVATASTMVAMSAGSCPDEMANMGRFCVDKFEASRPDSTPYDQGTGNGPARSVAGVLPWQLSSSMEAVSACMMAGKRLCTLDEWRSACSGSLGDSGFLYPYGNTHVPSACNDYWTMKGGIIGTGKMPQCVSRVGAYDMIGNLWELVTDAGGVPAYAVGDQYYLQITETSRPTCARSESLDPEPWTRASAYGFRCCKDAQ